MAKLNGENIAGAAFLFFSALLISAGQVNTVFGKLYAVYYILVAAGMALVFLGHRTSRSDEKVLLHREHYHPS